jgi:hypothetical protein
MPPIGAVAANDCLVHDTDTDRLLDDADSSAMATAAEARRGSEPVRSICALA